MNAHRPTTSYVDAVEEELKSEILAGQLAEGEKLPPERELSDRFGVNRVTVRSALGRLQNAGLVDVRQGRGYTVLRYQETAGPGILSDLIKNEVRKDRAAVIEDLLRVRRAMVGALIETIDFTPETVNRIGTAIEGFVSQVPKCKNGDEIVEAELRIIEVVVASADSVVLQLFVNPLQQGLRYFPQLTNGCFPQVERVTRIWLHFLTWMRGNKHDTSALLEALRLADKEAMTVVRRELGDVG